MIKMILAVDQGNSIGWTDGTLPWNLKKDMKRFKELTTGHTVVMGFKTFVSLGKPDGLPNRRNIVLTRKSFAERKDYPIGDNVDLISDFNWVLRQNEVSKSQAAENWMEDSPVTWIIGGASIYDEALLRGIVDEIYLTIVHTVSGADIKLQSDIVAWKRFVLTEQKRGINWHVTHDSVQQDGDFETTYLHFRKMKQ